MSYKWTACLICLAIHGCTITATRGEPTKQALDQEQSCKPDGSGASSCSVDLLQRQSYQRSLHENASSASGQRRAAAPAPSAAQHVSAAAQNASSAAQLGTGANELTVMLLNTYLIEMAGYCYGVFVVPDHRHRAQELANWFNTLTTDAVPDVLVLNEVFGGSGKDLVRAICSNSWQGNSWLTFGATTCDPSSHFSVASPMTGARPFDFELFVPSGIVVLLKKGIDMLSHDGYVFPTQGGFLIPGLLAVTAQGVTTVHLRKAGQEYWVLGTHTQSAIGELDTRLTQMQQLRTYVEANIPSGSRIVIAGDMNLYEFPWNDTCITGTDFRDEVPLAKQVLGGGVETIAGTLESTGFWLPLAEAVDHSWDVARNHYGLNVLLNVPENNQRFDWIMAPGAADMYESPLDMKYQYVPVKTSTCYCSELNQQGADDLSDHYGVFAQLCYAGSCPAVPQVTGHLGAGGRMPGADPACSFSTPCGPPPVPRGFIAKIVYALAGLLGLVESQLECSGCL